MRLLFISDRYPPHLVGGYEVLCHDIVTRLARRGHECLVVASNYRAKGPEQEAGVRRVLHLPHTSANLLQHGIWERVDSWQLRRAVRNLRPDLVSTWSLRWLFGSVHREVAQIAAPVVANLHGLWLKGHVDGHNQWCDTWARPGSNPARALLKEGVRALMLRLDREWLTPIETSELRLDHAVFGSEFTRAQHEAAGLRFRNWRVIHSGIDSRRFTARALSERPLQLSLLFVGRLVPDKGAHVAIHAVAALVAAGRKVRLTIMGIPAYPFEYARELRKLVEQLGLEALVHFEKPVPNAQLQVVYAAHDVFLFPSWHPEAISMALLGAMSCGMAVISTTVGGSGEVVRHRENALVVPASDPGALGMAIGSLLDEPGLARQLGESARKTIVTRFELETVTTQMEDFLRDVVEGGH